MSFLIIDNFSCWTSTNVSFLHFGQNNGKFISTVSKYALIRVLFLQIEHKISLLLPIKSSFAILYHPLTSVQRISIKSYLTLFQFIYLSIALLPLSNVSSRLSIGHICPASDIGNKYLSGAEILWQYS